ncbi:bifunctional histidinol-phosphatase/imidazoleglycerol-phosphate dehydratase HisB [Barnesiella viscericola]|uniref:Histidine biosynthesis bifunctional protein HisB n=1 Tax=Barnesiella viscericola TaxID=397865 RepID=A0A921SV20_9BACT|nr:bifunctional histidinol-phosphatase/imidazoleglycerol-phosphate dehydratase HisB [Barnesiella viscericola]HJG88944.1 bifunctional histidinol-phosphatase/imidazoleglycerol-phosphate dehydratase HisB [Barnesiella viscericola]
MKRVLFIDRDGTLVVEPPVDYQLDSLEKLEFRPRVFQSLAYVAARLDFEWVMVTNQDGMGTPSFPAETFWPAQHKIIQALANEGIRFDEVCIDTSLPEEQRPTRKPGTAMLTRYMAGDYDLVHSYVIGDRLTDVQLAANLGCRAIYFAPAATGVAEVEAAGLAPVCEAVTDDWWQVAQILCGGTRRVSLSRRTAETDIQVSLNLDGTGCTQIHTGLGFFDHMLDQLGRHSGVDLRVDVAGDLQVDEHHTIEDTALVLGEAFARALGDKRGIARYGFSLPMDDALCRVALDFGGRPWLVWKARFRREKIGDMPTEMFLHFFKSFSDAARMNLHIEAVGANEHHKIEGIFKAFARALKMAVKRDVTDSTLPSTKGSL